MIGVNCFLIAAVLWLSISHAEGSNCSCKCGKYSVCDNFNNMRGEVDLNVAEIRKWTRYFSSVSTYHTTWASQGTWNEHFEVQLNETANMAHSCLASQRQLGETVTEVQTNIEQLQSVQSEILDTDKNMAVSLEALGKDVNDREVITQNDIRQLKQELSRIQTSQRQLKWTVTEVQKNIEQLQSVQSETLDTVKNMAVSLEALRKDVNYREVITQNDISQLKQELSHIQSETKPECGVVDNNAGRNAGSSFVLPWMAAVYKNGNQYACDGSIINRNFVLTSAWCMTYFGGISNGISVKLGLSNLQKGTYLQERKVKQVIKHSKFYGGTGLIDNHDYDIALLKLEEPIQLGPFVRTICLPPTETYGDDPFYKPESIARAVVLQDYIAAASSSQDAAPIMLNLTILPPAECRSKLKEGSLEQMYSNPDLSFCAESSTTECPREGSPVMQFRLAGDGTRTWTQVGIRSWNVKCELFFIPRLDRLRTWMETWMKTSSTQQ